MKKFLLGIGIIIASISQASFEKINIEISGLKRWALFQPIKTEAQKKYPLLIILHGGGGTPKGFIKSSKLASLAENNHVFLVAPAGSGKSSDKLLTWNAKSCCGYAAEKNIDDVSFIKKLIEELSKKNPIDNKKIYIAGHSNGAIMAYYLACELSDQIAGIFSNAAPSPADELKNFCPSLKIAPIFHVQGLLDHCAPYEGGENCGGCFEKFFGITKKSAMGCYSIKKLQEDIKTQMTCNTTVTVQVAKKVNCTQYSDCRNNFHYKSCTIEDGGHSWPGGVSDLKFCESRPNGILCNRWKSIVGENSRRFDFSREIIATITK